MAKKGEKLSKESIDKMSRTLRNKSGRTNSNKKSELKQREKTGRMIAKMAVNDQIIDYATAVLGRYHIKKAIDTLYTGYSNGKRYA